MVAEGRSGQWTSRAREDYHPVRPAEGYGEIDDVVLTPYAACLKKVNDYLKSLNDSLLWYGIFYCIFISRDIYSTKLSAHFSNPHNN